MRHWIVWLLQWGARKLDGLAMEIHFRWRR